MAGAPTGVWDSAFQDCSSRLSGYFKASFTLTGLIAFRFKPFHFDDRSYDCLNVSAIAFKTAGFRLNWC